MVHTIWGARLAIIQVGFHVFNWRVRIMWLAIVGTCSRVFRSHRWERNLAALSLGTYGDDSNSRNYSVTLSATGERVRIISLFLDLGDWFLVNNAKMCNSFLSWQWLFQEWLSEFPDFIRNFGMICNHLSGSWWIPFSSIGALNLSPTLLGQ